MRIINYGQWENKTVTAKDYIEIAVSTQHTVALNILEDNTCNCRHGHLDFYDSGKLVQDWVAGKEESEPNTMHWGHSNITFYRVIKNWNWVNSCQLKISNPEVFI